MINLTPDERTEWRRTAAFVSDHNNFPALLKALEDVLALHRGETSLGLACEACGVVCGCCGEVYPCPTVTAIEAALAEAQHG